MVAVLNHASAKAGLQTSEALEGATANFLLLRVRSQPVSQSSSQR